MLAPIIVLMMRAARLQRPMVRISPLEESVNGFPGESSFWKEISASRWKVAQD